LGDVKAHSKPQLQQGKNVKERNWERIPLAMFGNPNSKQMIVLHAWSLLNLDFVDIMWICARFMNM